jgi:two-component system response regulator DesR
MPRLSGIELARRSLRVSPDTALVFYTGYGDRALVTEALDVGVRGVVLKEAPLADVIRAVELVGRGGTYVDPVLAGVLATARFGSEKPALTQRERDVLRLLSEGCSNDGVGKELFISAETVRTHVRKAMDKLGADNRTEAVATALRAELIA